MQLPVTEFVMEKTTRMEDILIPVLDSGVKTLVVSAGGDGTMNYLVNQILALKNDQLNQITLGAIGLGSSNDFLKPFGEKIHNIPVRINCNGGSILHDIGLVTFINGSNTRQKKYFIVNASLGVTAYGNWNFNNPGNVLIYLKKKSTNLAILYTAIKTILTYKNQLCKLEFNDNVMNVPVSNINILKIPFVSGSLHYDQKVLPDDGRLGLHLCLNMNKRELLFTLRQLEKGKFPNNKKRISTYTNLLSCSSLTPVVFECDGETDIATDVSITIVPNAIRVLKS